MHHGAHGAPYGLTMRQLFGEGKPQGLAYACSCKCQQPFIGLVL